MVVAVCAIGENFRAAAPAAEIIRGVVGHCDAVSQPDRRALSEAARGEICSKRSAGGTDEQDDSCSNSAPEKKTPTP